MFSALCNVFLYLLHVCLGVDSSEKAISSLQAWIRDTVGHYFCKQRKIYDSTQNSTQMIHCLVVAWLWIFTRKEQPIREHTDLCRITIISIEFFGLSKSFPQVSPAGNNWSK